MPSQTPVALFELELTDHLVVRNDGGVDIYDPKRETANGRLHTVEKFRDPEERQCKAMVEQIDGDHFFFVSLEAARRFMGVHGMIEVDDATMAKFRQQACGD